MGDIIDVQRGSECSRVVIDAATVSLYCIVLYWFEAAPPAAADKGFARFRSYVPNLMVVVLLRGTLVAVVRSILKQVVRDE